MLPARHRLRRSADVKRVRRSGARWQHPLLALYAAPNDREISRFAVSAGRRVGKAVVRNRNKRRVRASLQQHLAEVRGGWDCLVIIGAAATDASYAEINEAIGALLCRAGLISSTGRDLGHA